MRNRGRKEPTKKWGVGETAKRKQTGGDSMESELSNTSRKSTVSKVAKEEKLRDWKRSLGSNGEKALCKL